MSLDTIVSRVRGVAEVVVAALLAVMFAAFVIQIVFRYFFNFPLGWSSELTVVAWLYMVLIGSAYWLRQRDEIHLDLLTGVLGQRGRRLVAGLVAGVAAVLFAISFPATWRYVTFMKVESTSYMKIRLDILYAVYLFFAAALIVRYGWRVWNMLRGGAIEETDITKASSGL